MDPRWVCPNGDRDCVPRQVQHQRHQTSIHLWHSHMFNLRHQTRFSPPGSSSSSSSEPAIWPQSNQTHQEAGSSSIGLDYPIQMTGPTRDTTRQNLDLNQSLIDSGTSDLDYNDDGKLAAPSNHSAGRLSTHLDTRHVVGVVSTGETVYLGTALKLMRNQT